MLVPNQRGFAARNLLACAACVLAVFCLDPALTVTAEEASSVPAAPPPVPAAPGVGGKCASCIGALGSMLSGCKQHCCTTPLGKLLNGLVQPIEFATGGVIPAPCPGPNAPARKPDDTGGSSEGPPGPQDAAEAIKQDQAQAKARAEAVRYLATVPCHYYPEAEVALITALRTDRSECVRWEAAHALAQGCCCTKKTIEALKIAAEGSQRDGNPREMSIRVRVEAINALQHCLAVHGEALAAPQRPEKPDAAPETIPTPPLPRRPESPRGGESDSQAARAEAGVRFASYYESVEGRPARELVAEARHLVELTQPVAVQQGEPRGGKSLFELWMRAKARPAAPDGSVATASTSAGGSGTSIPGREAATVAPVAVAGHDQRPDLVQLPPVSVLHSPPAVAPLNAEEALTPGNVTPYENAFPHATTGEAARSGPIHAGQSALPWGAPAALSLPSGQPGESAGWRRHHRFGYDDSNAMENSEGPLGSAMQGNVPPDSKTGPLMGPTLPDPASTTPSSPFSERFHTTWKDSTILPRRPNWLTEQVLAHDGDPWR